MRLASRASLKSLGSPSNAARVGQAQAGFVVAVEDRVAQVAVVGAVGDGDGVAADPLHVDHGDLGGGPGDAADPGALGQILKAGRGVVRIAVTSRRTSRPLARCELPRGA